jgi:hypothetical protein
LFFDFIIMKCFFVFGNHLDAFVFHRFHLAPVLLINE